MKNVNAHREMTVLLVEDDPDISQLFRQSLAIRGYTVDTAPNGRAALEILGSAASLPSVIVADLHMPIMDGWEFLTALSKEPRLAGIPVVVLTAADDPARSAPRPSTILIKPVSIDDLIAAMQRAVTPAH
jgi:two-component system chemotaxis response regulator CheY